MAVFASAKIGPAKDHEPKTQFGHCLHILERPRRKTCQDNNLAKLTNTTQVCYESVFRAWVSKACDRRSKVAPSVKTLCRLI